MPNKVGLKSISKGFKAFHPTLVLLIIFFSAYSVAATVTKPVIECNASITNQTRCGIEFTENYNGSINKTTWNIENGDITSKTIKSAKIERKPGKTTKTIIEAKTKISNQTYNLTHPVQTEKTRKPNEIGEKRDKETKNDINLGNFTDKKNRSNIKNKTGDKPRKTGGRAYNLSQINVKCPESVNTTNKFFCTAEIAKNNSSNTEVDWHSEKAEITDKEKLKAEFKAGKSLGTILVRYKANISGKEIISTDKVTVENPKPVKPPVQKPSKEEKIKKLNRTLERKNKTIETLRNKIKQLEKELNKTKSNNTVEIPENKPEEEDGLGQNKSENIVKTPETGTNTDQNTSSKPSSKQNESSSESEVRNKDDNVGKNIIEAISSFFN